MKTIKRSLPHESPFTIELKSHAIPTEGLNELVADLAEILYSHFKDEAPSIPLTTLVGELTEERRTLAN